MTILDVALYQLWGTGSVVFPAVAYYNLKRGEEMKRAAVRASSECRNIVEQEMCHVIFYMLIRSGALTTVRLKKSDADELGQMTFEQFKLVRERRLGTLTISDEDWGRLAYVSEASVGLETMIDSVGKHVHELHKGLVSGIALVALPIVMGLSDHVGWLIQYPWLGIFLFLSGLLVFMEYLSHGLLAVYSGSKLDRAIENLKRSTDLDDVVTRLDEVFDIVEE